MYHRPGRNWKASVTSKKWEISRWACLIWIQPRWVEGTCRPDVAHWASFTRRPSAIGSLDFPVGQDTSSLLGQLTNNRPSCIVCKCVFVCGVLHHILCASSKTNEFILQTTKKKKKQAPMHVCAGVRACRNACVCLCVCGVCACLSMFMSNYPPPQSWSERSAVSWLPFIKSTVGGYWAFPVHHQNTKQSPTLFCRLPAAHHWSPSCVHVFVLIPFTLVLPATKNKTKQTVYFL